LHALNYQRNTHSAQLHVIEYYLNQEAYRHLAPKLTPHFKQERNTIHSLELYLDSPDVENLALSPHVTCSYFSAGVTSETLPANIGLHFQLHPAQASHSSRSLAYLSGMPWTSTLASHLQ